MNILAFDTCDRDALIKLEAYPAIVALPATFMQAADPSSGRHRTPIGSAYAGKDAKVISDVYSPVRNRLDLIVCSQGGSVESGFRARLDIGRRESRNYRTLRVKLLEAPHKKGSKDCSGVVVDSAGGRHRLRLPKFSRCLQEQLQKQLESLYRDNGIPTDIDWKIAGGKRVKEALDFGAVATYTWCPPDYRAAVAASRLLHLLCYDSRHMTTLKQAVDSHLLPDYPELEVPYSVFHMFDTSVKLTFVGIIQRGGASNRTKNLQTANKLSRIMGQSINADELVTSLQAKGAPYLLIQPNTEVYCVAVVNKVTKAA